jgi:hypothetical protein
MILVDSNIFFDLVDRDPVWEPWSVQQLRINSTLHELVTNPIIFAELSPRYATPDDVDAVLTYTGVRLIGLPKEAEFLAGKTFHLYRRQGGLRTSLLAHSFIGAHATVLGAAILTRDTRRYATCFPTVRLIAP